MNKNCKHCKKEFKKPLNCSKKEWKTRLYCSHICGYKERNIGKIEKTCPTCKSTFKKAYMGKRYCSLNCRPSDYWKGKIREDLKGNKNYNWKGGTSSINDKLRHTSSIRLWRKSVLERDNFTCQKTGITGGELDVHHINNFSEFPDLRTSIENGITLSKIAHVQFHKIYGKKNNTLEQLLDFINNKN